MDKKLDNKKLLLILMAIVLIIVIIIVVLLLIQFKEKEVWGNEDDDIEENAEDFVETYGIGKNGNIDTSSYFDIINCAKQYFDMINVKNDAYYTYDEKGNYVLAVDEAILKQNIYNILSKSYIAKNDITVENVYEKIETLDTSTLLVPLEISMVQNKDIKSFVLHTLLETQKDYKVVKDTFIIVNIDIANFVYSIEPLSGNYKNIEDVKVSQLDTQIEINKDNRFEPAYGDNQEISKDYINLYKRLALGSPEKLYNLLDEEYRNARFGSLDNFNQYIQNKKENIINIRLEKYQVTRKDSYTQYVCVDQNERYYIFREIAPMKYTVILDTYTIDLPEFIDKYNNSSNEEKALLNIQRFFSAIDYQDYKYAYNKLDATFKNNNFKTQAEFESYVKKNFFTENKLLGQKVEKQGDVYLCNIAINDGTEKTTNTVTKSFVMKLKEGTEFVMSFSVK